MQDTILKKLKLTEDDLFSRKVWLLGAGDESNVDTMMALGKYVANKNVKASVGKKEYKEEILSMKEGDLVIIKVATTDSRDRKIPTMRIYAVGVVDKESKDGKTVGVYYHRFRSEDKEKNNPLRWYYDTEFPLVTLLDPNSNERDKDLVRFAFLLEEQDVEKYLAIKEEKDRDSFTKKDVKTKRNPKAEEFLDSVLFANK